jgi:hypothetical protein
MNITTSPPLVIHGKAPSFSSLTRNYSGGGIASGKGLFRKNSLIKVICDQNICGIYNVECFLKNCGKT